MSLEALLERAKGAQGAKIPTLGYRNFGIFGPGAVPRSSALCLFVTFFNHLFLFINRGSNTNGRFGQYSVRPCQHVRLTQNKFFKLGR